MNYKFLNILIVMIIIFVGILLFPYVGHFVQTVFFALLPLLLAFILAYVLHPVVTQLERLKIPRWVAILLIYSLVITFIIYLIFGVVRPAIDSLGDLSVGIRNILEEIGQILSVDTTAVADYVVTFVDELVQSITAFFTATGSAVSTVWETFVGGAVIIIVGIIFLLNFNRMRQKASYFLRSRYSEKTYLYVKTLDEELTNYLLAEVIIAGIQFLEYATLMLIISFFIGEMYQYILLVGIVAAVFSLIPYFGGYLSVIFTAIIIMTIPGAAIGMIALLIFMLIFPQLDAYVINPRIFKTHLKLNPIITIGFILLGQAFFGFVGAILSVPIQVVLMITLKFYKGNMVKGVKKFKDAL